MDTSLIIQGAFTLFSAVIGIIVTRIKIKMQKDAKEQQKAIARRNVEAHATILGLQSLLRNSIIQLHDRCLRNGQKKTYYDTQDMEYMYEAYHDLGGNGMVKEIYDDFKSFELLPRK